jgi:hypothetical protein
VNLTNSGAFVPRGFYTKGLLYQGAFDRTPRIVLSLQNIIKKNVLISKVIKTDKTRGINLSVNEYLSSNNAHLLYKLRCLRKECPNKIFACYSRNGNIFYKEKIDSRPRLIMQQEDIDALTDDIRQHGRILQGQNPRRNPHRNGRPQMHNGNSPPVRFRLQILYFL